jgi:transcriptional regulator with AAA-type ATPase domain
MATTKISLAEEKINELTSFIKVMTARETEDKNDPTYIAKSTKQTQLYHMKRERRVLALIKHLIAANPDLQLSPEDQETFVLITTLSSERKATKYVFNEGDDLYDTMSKYENLSRKDLEKKLEKIGLKADFAAGKIVKA